MYAWQIIQGIGAWYIYARLLIVHDWKNIRIELGPKCTMCSAGCIMSADIVLYNFTEIQTQNMT